MNYRYNFHCFCLKLLGNASLKYKETIVRNFPEQRNKVLQQFVPLTCFKDRHGGLHIVHSDLSFLNINRVRDNQDKILTFSGCFLEIWK